MNSIDPRIYQILVVKRGIMALKEGFRLNRAYTPGNLKAMTEQLTGKKFRQRSYDSMIEALEELLEQKKGVDNDT